MDASELYWLPFRQVYQQLQAANKSSIASLNELLNLNLQWLLEGLGRFERPSEQSAKALQAGKVLKAPAWGSKRGITIDKHLVEATLDLSNTLDLNEIQCHLLLKRWLKNNDVNIPAPAVSSNTAAPLALPAPANSGAGTATGAQQQMQGLNQAVLLSEVVQGVADYYAQERIYLTKCQQFVIMNSMDPAADASQSCRDLLRRLLDASWESKVYDNLAALLKPAAAKSSASKGPGSDAGGSGSKTTSAMQAGAFVTTAGASSGSPHMVKPLDFDQRLLLHKLQQRCEVLSLLTQLYCGTDPTCLATAFKRQQAAPHAANDSESTGVSASGAAAAAEVAGMRWPKCSEERLQQLLQLLGDAVFAGGVAGAGIVSVVARAAASGNEALHLQQLSEALACSVILAALRPGQLVQLLAEHATAAAAGGPLPRSVSPFKQWRSIEAALMQWKPAPGCVTALLTLYAYNQLLASSRGASDPLSPSIQQAALQAGGFGAMSAPLSLEELSGSALAGAMHRGLLLQSASLMAAAFDLSPWRLPGAVLQDLIGLITDSVQGCPHLAQQFWDESNPLSAPQRHILNETCALFPAFPGPFLQLASGLCQGPAAAAACYSYLCSKPSLTVQYKPEVQGLRQEGSEAVLEVDMPWAKAPEVQGSYLPQGSHGKLMPLPAFARPKLDTEAAAADGDLDLAADEGPQSFLVAWDVAADQGIGPVLLLARAAHCLQALHAVHAGRQPVPQTEYWQDLRLILKLLAALLQADPLLAQPLLAVTIVYTNNQQMDWLDVLVASLNVLPNLAPCTANGVGGNGSMITSVTAAAAAGVVQQQGFKQQVLAALGDCLTAAAAAGICQPGRVVSALGECQLFAGVDIAPNPLPLVPLEGLAEWMHGQQGMDSMSGSAVGDWSELSTLQVLQESLEVPSGLYPLTTAVIHLTQTFLNHHCTWGLIPSLVGYTLHRVLGAMPWLPFNSTAERWQLAAAAFGVVRSGILAGAVAAPGGFGPKAVGPPGGLMITILAARVTQHLATAGHGYLSSVMPPSADVLKDMAEQQAGSSDMLAAATSLTEQLLLLVPVVLAAAAHLSLEMPLQQFWGADPPGGGLSPAAVIASYATYPYATHLPLLTLDALNAFATLQTNHSAAAVSSSSGLGFNATPPPSSGGPPVPVGPVVAASAGPVGGLVTMGLNPGQPYNRGIHSAVATGVGFGGKGAAGGWWRPSGLFAAMLAALPGLRPALLMPFEAAVAQEYPEWAMRAITLLEAGIRFHPEILDAMCFPSGLGTAGEPSAKSQGSSGLNKPSGRLKLSQGSTKPHSALDGIWQLLQQSGQLLQTQPKLLASVLRVLSVLWECQGSTHGAVELLRSQSGFWQAVKACLPLPADMVALMSGGDQNLVDLTAWRLQVHTCTLHITLLELLSVPVGRGDSSKHQPADGAASSNSTTAAAAGHESLLSALGPKDLAQLLLACAQLGLQPALLDQLTRILQVTYLQLGSSAVAGAWGPPSLRTGTLSVSAQFRAEVQPLLVAAAAGEYNIQDLQTACNLLASRDAAAAELQLAAAADDVGMEDTGGGGGGRGRVLADMLSARPFGEVLLGYAGVTPWSWSAGETEYGRQFLFDSSRLCQLLGPFVLDSSEGALALAITLDDVSVAASVMHARLSLMQAAASLLASLGRHPAARHLLLSPDAGKQLLSETVQAVEKALHEASHLASSPAASLLLAPWSPTFIGHASSVALLLAAQSLLLAVRVWKVASGAAGAGVMGQATTAAANGSSSSRGGGASGTGRPVLMARTLNHQDSGHSSGGLGFKQSRPAASSGVPGVSEGRTRSTLQAAAQGCAACARQLAQWLRGKGGESLAAAAADDNIVAGTVAADVETVECLSTGLLLLLQVLPGYQQQQASGAAGAGVAAGKRPSSGTPAAAAPAEEAATAEVLELRTVLLDLLPALCKASAMAVAQQQQQQPQQGVSSLATVLHDAHAAAAMLQLQIEILQHHLPPSMWLGTVSDNLAMVPMLIAAAAAAASSGGPPKLADSSSKGTAAAAATGGAEVISISVLELTLAVSQTPEGALKLWQQGVLPVLAMYCRQLLHTQLGTGLLDVSALGLVGPDTARVYGAGAAAAGYGNGSSQDLPPQVGVSVSTLGAYSAGGNSVSSSSSSSTPCVWSPRHQQWCLLLSLLSTILQELSKSVGVEDIAMQLFVAAEPRLLLAVELQHPRVGGSSRDVPPAAGSRFNGAGHPVSLPAVDTAVALQPLLTLGGLLEAERTLFFLRFMVPHMGIWQLQRPGSLMAFRTAAASLVEFVTRPSLNRTFCAWCPPLSPFERRLGKLPSGLEPTDGWFKVCAAGGANSLLASSATAGGSPGTFTAASPIVSAADTAATVLLLPSSPEAAAAAVAGTALPGGFSGTVAAAAGRGVAASAGGSAAAGCSEYCARLCEAIYTACEHSLLFLLATAPAVEPGEGATAAREGNSGGSSSGLGPTWPSPQAFGALQDQVLAVATSMLQQPHSVTPRRRRVAACCCRIAAAAAQLLEAVAPSPWGSSSDGSSGSRRGAAAAADAAAAAADAARRVDRLTNIQRALAAAAC